MNYIVFTDGGSRGNPGPAATGVVIYDSEKNEICRLSNFLGIATNNVAEYSALKEALEKIKTLTPITSVECFLDSELVVKQLKGEYKIKSPDMLTLSKDIQRLIKDISAPVSFTHIPRSENKLADALVNETLDFHLKG